MRNSRNFQSWGDRLMLAWHQSTSMQGFVILRKGPWQSGHSCLHWFRVDSLGWQDQRAQASTTSTCYKQAAKPSYPFENSSPRSAARPALLRQRQGHPGDSGFPAASHGKDTQVYTETSFPSWECIGGTLILFLKLLWCNSKHTRVV